MNLLDKSASSAATGWLRDSLTRFATPVAAFVPDHFAGYARIYHPFGAQADPELRDPRLVRWGMLAGREIESADEAANFALDGPSHAQAHPGTLSREVADRLIDLLSSATTTPDACFFALWEGFADSVVPQKIKPTLELPHRRYHVFAGSLQDARAGYSCISFSYRSANLWWPADHAWCVATEVDLPWTYVAGSRAIVDAILVHPELDAIETAADAPW